MKRKCYAIDFLNRHHLMMAKIYFFRVLFSLIVALFLEVNCYAAPLNQYTIEFLIRTDVVAKNKVLLVSGSDTDEIFLNNEGYLLDSFSNKGIAISSHKALNDGNWHHVASVVNSTRKYLFVDNVLSGMVDIQDPKGNINWSKIRIGGTAYDDDFQSDTDYFSGAVDRFTLTFEALYTDNAIPTFKSSVTDTLGGPMALRVVAGALPGSVACAGMTDWTASCFENSYSKGYLDLNLVPPLIEPTDIIVKTGTNSAVIYFSQLKAGDIPVSYTVSNMDQSMTYSSENSPLNITGLIYGKTYNFKMYGSLVSDRSIRGPDSSLITIIPGQAEYALPAAPKWIKATAGIESATVTFAAAGGPEVYKYTVTVSPGNKVVTGATSPIVITGLNKLTAYTFRVKASNNIGTGANSVDSNTIIPLSPPETPPSVPNNFFAKNIGYQTVVYFDSPALNNPSLPVSEYIVTAYPGETKTQGSVSPITITGLEAGRSYRFKIRAKNSIGSGPNSEFSNSIVIPTPTTTTTTTTTTTSTTAAQVNTTTLFVTTTTTAISGSVTLAKGWNLIGAGGTQSFKASSLFGDKNTFVTVWKWIADRGQWAFYAPSMTATALSDYALGKGYQVLDTIQGSDGFWVNASSATSVSLPFGTAYTAIDHRASLRTGWNLISSGDNLTPVRFNNYLTIYSGSMPPSIGSETTTTVYQDNLTSLWAWDAANSKWYFYAPSLDRSQVLGDYISGKGYLNFTTDNKKLGSGVGFWVNMPTK